MATEPHHYLPTSYDGWSRLLRGAAGSDGLDEQGNSVKSNTLVRRVSFPPGLIGMSAFCGAVNIAGHPDMGFKLRVRGRFPSREQATYVVQRTPFTTARRPEDFWIGVHTTKLSVETYFEPVRLEYAFVPTPDELDGSNSEYMRLEPEEYIPFEGLIIATAHKLYGGVVPPMPIRSPDNPS